MAFFFIKVWAKHVGKHLSMTQFGEFGEVGEPEFVTSGLKVCINILTR